ILTIGVLILVFRQREIRLWSRPKSTAPVSIEEVNEEKIFPTRHFSPRLWIASFPTLLDLGIVRTMVLSFIVGFVALVLIFDVFTTFELWRFISSNGAGVKLVAEYLFYLLPLVSVELFPGSVLVAALMTYALIARRREAVAWWASGQSVYRLMLPGIIFAIAVATGAWFIQERVMPRANIIQDSLRARIRGNIAQLAAGSERRWLVSTDGSRIYSYDFDDARQLLLKPTIYEFDSEQIQLKRVIKGEEGKWLLSKEFEISKAQWINLEQAKVALESADQLKIGNVDPPSVFRPTVDRPSQMDAIGLRNYVRALKARGAETATLAVALQRKYAAP